MRIIGGYTAILHAKLKQSTADNSFLFVGEHVILLRSLLHLFFDVYFLLQVYELHGLNH